MSYEVANDSKSLGQFASNKGYMDLVQAVQHRGYSRLEAFFSSGQTDDVDSVVRELKTFIPQASDKDTAMTATTLMRLITGQSMAVITDGVV